jgi:hypothetical protein
MKRNNLISFFALGVTLCATVSGIAFVRRVQADVIYSQTTPSQPLGAFSSNDRPTYQKIADNFLFNGSAPVTIRSLRFIGGYGVTNPPPQTPPLNALPTDNFRIVFFADSAGAPSFPLNGGNFNVGVPVDRTATGGPLLNGVVTPIEYSVDFGAGISLSPGAIYWMSIVNDPEADYFWAWARAGGVYDQQTAGTVGDITGGPWSIVTNGGMWFELSDSNVPEPSSFGVFLAGACGMYCVRVRRCSRNHTGFGRPFRLP